VTLDWNSAKAGRPCPSKSDGRSFPPFHWDGSTPTRSMPELQAVRKTLARSVGLLRVGKCSAALVRVRSTPFPRPMAMDRRTYACQLQIWMLLS